MRTAPSVTALFLAVNADPINAAPSTLEELPAPAACDAVLLFRVIAGLELLLLFQPAPPCIGEEVILDLSLAASAPDHRQGRKQVIPNPAPRTWTAEPPAVHSKPSVVLQR